MILKLELSLKILGAALWLAFVALMQLDPGSESWIVLLLMFSPLVLMPLSRKLVAVPELAGKHELVSMAAAIMLGLSFCWKPAMSTSALAMPWLVVRLLAAFDAVRGVRGSLSLGQICVLASRVFPAIGAAWLVAHRGNWTPFAFDPVIVLLTAAHFHHAGFTLPLIAGLHGQARPDGWSRFSCGAILAGVPLVAVGITCTHFGWLPWVEPMGVTLLVLGCLVVAGLQLRLACRSGFLWSHRLLFAVSGAASMAAMILALGFGLRHLLPWAALTMPQMWMIHGSLNVFGFGLCGILGWRSVKR